MLTASPVVRSASARALFLASAAITVAILRWTEHIRPVVGDFATTGIFRMLFCWYDAEAATGLVLILVLAALVARPDWLRPVASWVSDHTLAIAAATAMLLSLGSMVLYGNDPFTMDEFAPFSQAKVFAAGHLAGRYPLSLMDWLIPPGYHTLFQEISPTTGEVACKYWPSYALLLVPFMWLGIPWACNPVISAATLLVTRRLALELFEDRETAGFAVLFTVASPVLFGAGTSYYSEPAHLLTNALYALLLMRPDPRKALAAGFVGSIALTLHNPFPHAFFALPWFVWLATQRQAIRLLAWLIVGYLPLSLLLGLGWQLFVHGLPYGNFSITNVLHDYFGARGPGDGEPAFTLIPRLGVLYARLIGLAKVWVWAVPGLLVLACAGAWKMRNDVRCRLLIASALTTLVGYSFVGFDQGHGWGFRYFHGAWFVLPLLAGAALVRSRTTDNANESFANDEVRAFVTACALLTLFIGIGQRGVQIHDFVTPEVSQGPRYSGKDARVVIYTGWVSRYGNALLHNDPFLRESAINLFSHGRDADAAMMHVQFPTMRKVYSDHWGTVWTDKPPAQSHSVASAQP
jgi:hypothetical protein